MYCPRRVLALGLLASSCAHGAQDGDLAAGSAGAAAVSIEIEDRVAITRVDDLRLGPWSGSGPLSASEPFCLYRNGSGLVDLTLSSDHAGDGGFRLSNGVATIPYTVALNGEAGLLASLLGGVGGAVGGLGGALGAGVGGRVGALTASLTGVVGDALTPDCGGSDNAVLEVRLSEEDLSGAPAGTYSDTLTVLIEPG